MGRETGRERRKEGRKIERGFRRAISKNSTSSFPKTTLYQVGAAAWSLAVVATLLGLSHPAVDKVREMESQSERGESRPE